MIVEFFDKLAKKYNIDYEVVVGDNSSDVKTSMLLQLMQPPTNVYIRITDQELFRMGIPYAHNRIVSMANSYNIFYVDSDEFPVWINPQLEEIYKYKYVPTTLRADFCTPKEIEDIFYELSDVYDVNQIFEVLKGKEISRQDRLYNCRYARFEGVCHSIFHVPEEFRSNHLGAVLCHCSTIRDKHKRDEYTNPIIDEQFARQNINPFLSSSTNVLKWGEGKTHQYKDWKEFVEKCRK